MNAVWGESWGFPNIIVNDKSYNLKHALIKIYLIIFVTDDR
jgi:hypothetical protein